MRYEIKPIMFQLLTNPVTGKVIEAIVDTAGRRAWFARSGGAEFRVVLHPEGQWSCNCNNHQAYHACEHIDQVHQVWFRETAEARAQAERLIENNRQHEMERALQPDKQAIGFVANPKRKIDLGDA